MTQSPPTESAASALRYTEQQLQDMPDDELAAAVAATVFGRSDAGGPFRPGWDGVGRIVEHMRARGYTLQLFSFEQSHLDWMNNLPGTIRRPAEVTVVDIHKRLRLGPRELNLQASADTLPRAAAIAAVLTCQREQAMLHAPVTPPETYVTWSDERRRQQSERMKRRWQQKRVAGRGKKGAGP